LQDVKATASSPTGIFKLPPKVVETPPSEQTVAAELGEKTPRENSFSLDGDAENRGHTRKHEDGDLQGRDGGDSDEEPSFGVAL
jgi:hypothetical protein